MTKSQSQDIGHGRAAGAPERPEGRWTGLRRTLGRIAGCTVLLAGLAAIAQVATSTPPPTYRTSLGGTYATLDAAEAALRSNTAYQGAEGQLEHVDTVQPGPTRLRMRYQVKPRPAERHYAPMYALSSALAGNGKPGCSTPVDDPTYANEAYCGNETSLVAHVESRLAELWPGCTLKTTVLSDYERPAAVIGTLSYKVDYDAKSFNTRGECSLTGTWKQHTWSVDKQVPFYCPTGYEIKGGALDGEDVGNANLCQPKNSSLSYIEVPVQQCATCAGSDHPIYPATGEKQRHEDDFSFAGRTFTRHYRSLRQFRNNPGFAVGWSHSWSERIIGTLDTSAPYALIDEAGDYEAYRLLSGNRYRGENSSDQLLERVNANGIGFRLRLPDGEVREYDTNGVLIAVRDPDAPQEDIVIAHAGGVVSRVTDAQGRVLRFEYGANLLRRIVLPDGAIVAYGYDADRNLISVTWPDNTVRRYHYNEAGLAGAADQRHQLTGITAETGRRFASFGYDARGRATSSRVLGTPNELTTVNYPTEDNAVLTSNTGATRAYVIEPGTYRRILSVQEEGLGETQSFDALGRLQAQVDRRGVRTEYEYDASGAYRAATIEAVGTPEQRREEIVRDPVTNLVTEHRIRDGAGVLKAQTRWTYNARGQVLSETEVDPVTAATRTTTTTYCEADDVAAGTCPMVGLVIARDGARDNDNDVVDITRYEYRSADEASCALAPTTCPWRKGDLWRIVDAKGQSTEVLAYDGAGRVRSVRDVAGVVTDYAYDPRGQLVATAVRGTQDASETDDRITRIEYTPDGLVARVIQPDGVFVRFTYDDAQRLVGITDRDGNTLSYTLDGAGQRLRDEVRDTGGALLQTLTRTYDTLGRLRTVTDAGQHTTHLDYDAEGLPTRTIDPLQREARQAYDALGRLTRSLRNATAVATATDRAEALYRYDTLDRTTRIIDPKGLATDYVYNGLGDLIEQRSPDTGVTTYVYDAAGNPASEVDANGKSTAYRYDALNRLRMADYAGPVPDDAYTWDVVFADCRPGEQYGAGRLGRVLDATGSTVYCYNRFGDLVRMVQRSAGRTFTVRWEYQADGRLQKLVYPGNAEVDYQYDAQGRVREVGVRRSDQREVLLTGATHHPFGGVSGWTYGNGLALRRTIGTDGLPVAVEDGPANGSGPGIALGYRFDAAGNLSELRSGRGAAAITQHHGYDGLDRLTEVRDAAGLVLEQYAYDQTGNRTRAGAWVSTGSSGEPGGGTPTYQFRIETYAYAADSHRLLQAGDEPRAYDAAGNLTRLGDPNAPGGARREFAYNDANRMGAVSRLSAPIASYAYNAHGERVRKTVNGVDTFTVYLPDGRWLGDFNGSGAPEQLAVWLDDLPVGLVTGAGTQQRLYYVEADALGAPRAVIDPQRSVAVWRWDAQGEAFGRDFPDQDADGDGQVFTLDLRYPGQRFDAETGLHYNYFRDYDPTTGRYVESDPIGLAGGMSTYGYADGSPLMRSDPDGLMAGLLLRFGLRQVLPRLGLNLGARAGARYAMRQAVWQARKKAFRSGVQSARSSGLKAQGCEIAARNLVGELSLSPAAQRALLREAMGASGTGKVAHHVVPLEAIKRFPELMRRAAQGGFNINGRANGALLDAANHVGGHPLYNRVVMEQLARINPALSPARVAAELQRVSNALQNSIATGRFGPWG